MTLAEQYDIYLDRISNRKRRPVKGATLAAYQSFWRTWIGPQLGKLPLKSIENGVMRQFVSHLVQNKLSAASIGNITQVVKGIIASATDENGNELYPRKWNSDYIDLPILDKKTQNTPTIDSKGVEKAIFEASSPYTLLFALLAASGLRINEALALRVGLGQKSSYWDPEGSKLVIQTALYRGVEQSPKTTAGVREVDLAPELNEYLKAADGLGQTGEYMFRGKDGGPMPVNTAYDAKNKLGLPGFHAFRRFRITHLENKEVPRGLAMWWTGHSGRDVHESYIKLDKDIAARKEWVVKAGLGFELLKARKDEAKAEAA
jgi:integrase